MEILKGRIISEIISREFIYFWHYFSIQFTQIVGYYALGMFLGSLISVFGKEKIHRLFASMQGKKFGVLGLIPASLTGIASPLCMYGAIPIAASFAKKGMEEDWLAAFMMASILLNPQLLIYSAALGTKALVTRFVICLVCGVAAGLCVRYGFKNRGFFTFIKFEEKTNSDTDPNLILRLLKNMARNLKATGPYFLFGLALSALFQRYVPQEAVTFLFGGNKAFGVLMAATIGVPLYACGGGTIPLLMAWMDSGMSLGSAAAFMITGPATKITNLGAVKIVLGLRNYLLYILFTILFALLSGIVINMVNL
ncbi:MAG: permease [Treponema sp.]|nr:permease [Treponema sp.]